MIVLGLPLGLLRRRCRNESLSLLRSGAGKRVHIFSTKNPVDYH